MANWMIVTEDELAFSLDFVNGQAIQKWIPMDSPWVRQVPEAKALAEAKVLQAQGIKCWAVEAE